MPFVLSCPVPAAGVWLRMDRWTQQTFIYFFLTSPQRSVKCTICTMRTLTSGSDVKYIWYLVSTPMPVPFHFGELDGRPSGNERLPAAAPRFSVVSINYAISQCNRASYDPRFSLATMMLRATKNLGFPRDVQVGSSASIPTSSKSTFSQPFKRKVWVG